MIQPRPQTQTQPHIPELTTSPGLAMLQTTCDKTPNNYALTYKVLDKLSCGIIRFDENLHLIQSNQAARKLLGYSKQSEISNEQVYEALSKINSLKIRKDRQDKELLCLWLEELANSLLTPSKQQPKPAQSFSGAQENNSFQSLLIKDDSPPVTQKKESLGNIANIHMAEFFSYLAMQDGARVKELFGPTSQSIQEEEPFIIDGKLKLNEQDFEKIIEVELFAINEEGHPGAQVIVTMKDMTIRDKVSVVENNSAFKDNLFGSMSHELRTPLNSIMSSLDSCLKDSDCAPKIKERFILPAFRSSKVLLSIIDDLLDYSKFQLNKFDPRFESFEILEAIEACLEIFQSNAERKGIQMSLNSQDLLSKRITSDRSRISQILMNLLSNAIKFTEFGGEVKVAVSSGQEPGFSLQISVEDTGIGMSISDLNRLLKSLEVWELVDKTSSNSSGAGIGLIISNRIATVLSADGLGLQINSEEGKGSIFTFRVIDQPEKKEPAPSSTENKTPFFNKIRLMSYTRFLEVGSKYLTGTGSINDIKLGMQPDSPFRKISSESPADRFKNVSLSTIKKESAGPQDIFDQIEDDLGALESERETSMQKGFPKAMAIKNFPKAKSATEIPISPQPKKESCCPSILIVDDDPSNHLAMEQMLSKLEFLTDPAFNGREAVNRYKLRVASPCKNKCPSYKLIFMDNNMPVKNGIDATMLIRDFEKCNKLDKAIILGCTAYTDQPVEYYISVGMDDCIFKPVNFETLSQVISKYLRSG